MVKESGIEDLSTVVNLEELTTSPISPGTIHKLHWQNIEKFSIKIPISLGNLLFCCCSRPFQNLPSKNIILVQKNESFKNNWTILKFESFMLVRCFANFWLLCNSVDFSQNYCSLLFIGNILRKYKKPIIPLTTTVKFAVINKRLTAYWLDQVKGTSFSEALIFASTNSKYDKRLFIELRVQDMKSTSSEHFLYINCFLFWHSEQFMYPTCSELVILMYLTRNSMNNLLSYCGLVHARIRASDKDLPVRRLLNGKNSKFFVFTIYECPL